MKTVVLSFPFKHKCSKFSAAVFYFVVAKILEKTLIKKNQKHDCLDYVSQTCFWHFFILKHCKVFMSLGNATCDEKFVYQV